MSLLTADSFNRADGALAGSSTDGAGSLDPLTWAALAGTFDIVSNTVRVTGGGGAYNGIAVNTGAGTTSVEVQATVATRPSLGSRGIGVLARAADASNYYVLYVYRTAGGVFQFYLSKLVAGVETVLVGPITSPSPADGDILKLTVNGTSIEAFVNGASIGSVTDSAHTTGTKHGLAAYDQGGTGALDVFSVNGLDVAISSADTGTGTDDASITAADISAADTGAGTDAAVLTDVTFTTGDTATATDAATVVVSELSIDVSDTATATDAAVVLVPPPPSVSSPYSSITATDILDLVANVGVVKAKMVFEVLDQNLNYLFNIHPITNDPVSIVANTASTVKRTLSSLHIDPDEEPLINVFSHRLRPSWVIEAPAGDESFPLGVFLFSDANRPRTTAGLELKGTMYDQTVILDQGIANSYGVASGTLIYDVLIAIAGEVGLAGDLLQIDFSPARTTSPVAYRVGTSRYKIMNELAQIAGYYPAFFNNSGILRFKLSPPSLAGIIPDHTYNAGATSRIINETIVESDDLVTAPNRWLVVNSGGTDAEISGYYDLPASAPQSYANRGYRVVKRVDEQGIESGDQATARAQQLAITDFNSFQWVQFNATPDPRHDLFDTVEYLHANYYEVGWTLKGTSGGPHTHKLRKVYGD